MQTSIKKYKHEYILVRNSRRSIPLSIISISKYIKKMLLYTIIQYAGFELRRGYFPLLVLFLKEARKVFVYKNIGADAQ